MIEKTLDIIKQLQNKTKQEIESISRTINHRELIMPKYNWETKLVTTHEINNIQTGFTICKAYNHNKNYKLENNKINNNQLIMIENFNPLDQFPKLSSRGKHNYSKVKKNDFKLGTLFNKQLIEQIVNSKEFDEFIITTNSQTPAGEAFFKSLKVDPKKLYTEGIPLNEFYHRSMEAAFKAGFLQ